VAITWVEIWDKGWHFTGMRQDPSGLDRGWFVDGASKANGLVRHAIYAAAFKSQSAFPAGVGHEEQSVPARMSQPLCEEVRDQKPIISQLLIHCISQVASLVFV
jgi:hypothetical protein